MGQAINMDGISVVIPTKDRKKDICQTLIALSEQASFVEECIIVDASESIFTIQDVPANLRSKTIIISSLGSVCIQRNIGIERAKASFIFLCDDDIEIQPNYLKTLKDYLVTHPSVDIVSGLVLEKDQDGNWTYLYPPSSNSALVWHWIFGLSFWFDVDKASASGLNKWILARLELKGNTISKSGWPQNVSLAKEVNVCDIYGLGASLSRKQWLKERAFDEVLDPSGIGDNYGLMLQKPTKIHVLNPTSVHHHKSETNRMQKQTSFFRRCLALHYFMACSDRFTKYNELLFLGSMLANTFYFLFRKNQPMRKASWKVFWLCFVGKNPYLLAKKQGLERIKPML